MPRRLAHVSEAADPTRESSRSGASGVRARANASPAKRTLFGVGAASKSAGDAPPGRATASGVSGSEKRTDRGRPLRFGVARGVAAAAAPAR